MADVPLPPATGSSAGRRRWWPPLLWAVVGALVVAGGYSLLDRVRPSESERTSPATTGPTTTLASSVAPKVFTTIRPSLVLVRASQANGDTSVGSGVIVTRKGEVMTADHVVAGASAVEVTFADGTTTSAQVVSSTPERDTALLLPQQLPSVVVPAVLGGGVAIGDDTFSVGNPLGLADTMTAGVVSGLDRAIERQDGSGDLTGLIQFDAAVNPGSSGGPLLNRQGQVVGIVTALANPTGQRFFVGIGFAVPIASGGGGANVPPS